MNTSLRQRLFQAYEQDCYALVVVLADQLLKQTPDDVHVLIRTGAACAALARYQRGEELLRQALELAPDAQRYLVLSCLGDLHKQRGEFALAAEYYASATRLAPDEADNYIFLGAVLARLGRLVEAEAAHRAATQCRDGCIDEAFLNLGLVLRAQDRLVEARSCIDKALAIDPNYEAAQEALKDVVAALDCSLV